MIEPTLEQVIENQQNVIELWAKKYAELEQQLAETKARIVELEIKEFMYDEHSDAVRKCLTLNKQLAAANGRLEEYEEKTCNCRWEGDTLVRQCELHKAQVDAIHEWAERAKVAEQRLWKLGLRNYQKRPVQTGNGSEGSDDI